MAWPQCLLSAAAGALNPEKMADWWLRLCLSLSSLSLLKMQMEEVAPVVGNGGGDDVVVLQSTLRSRWAEQEERKERKEEGWA